MPKKIPVDQLKKDEIFEPATSGGRKHSSGMESSSVQNKMSNEQLNEESRNQRAYVEPILVQSNNELKQDAKDLIYKVESKINPAKTNEMIREAMKLFEPRLATVGVEFERKIEEFKKLCDFDGDASGELKDKLESLAEQLEYSLRISGTEMDKKIQKAKAAVSGELKTEDELKKADQGLKHVLKEVKTRYEPEIFSEVKEKQMKESIDEIYNDVVNKMGQELRKRIKSVEHHISVTEKKQLKEMAEHLKQEVAQEAAAASADVKSKISILVQETRSKLKEIVADLKSQVEFIIANVEEELRKEFDDENQAPKAQRRATSQGFSM